MSIRSYLAMAFAVASHSLSLSASAASPPTPACAAGASPRADTAAVVDAYGKLPLAFVRMQLRGGNPDATPKGEDRLAGVVNHFSGSDPAQWRTRVPTFSKVRYEAVYPGIDLVYYGNQQQLEYDFVVAPGADPSTIALQFPGAESVRLDADGSLLLGLAGRELRWAPPVL